MAITAAAPAVSPMEITGTAGDFTSGLSAMDNSMKPGERVLVELVTNIMPTGTDLQHLNSNMIAEGLKASSPSVKIVDGFPVTSFIVTKQSESNPGQTAVGPALLALIPLIPAVIIGGLVAFGLFKIESITRALVPILLITFGGVIILAALLTRKPVIEAVSRKYIPR